MLLTVRVLHVLRRLDRGGAELRTIEVLRSLRPPTWQFTFVCLGRQAGSLAPQARELGADVVMIPFGLLFPVRFLRALRQMRVDVVHSHVATLSGAMLALARLAGVPTRVAHFRSDGDGRPDTMRRRAQRRLMRTLIHHCATDIIGVSPSALDFAGHGPTANDQRMAVVPNGLDLAVLRGPFDEATTRTRIGIGHDCPVLVHVGRSSPEKNRSRAVRILAVLHDLEPAAVLLMLGRITPTEQAGLNSLADELGVGAHVRFLGERADVAELLHCSDVTLATSTREGLPGVVLESCAVGTPVVSSDLPGARWISAWFDLVDTVALDRPDTEWVGAISARLTRGKTPHEEAVASFAGTPFTVERSVASLAAIWTGCPVDELS